MGQVGLQYCIVSLLYFDKQPVAVSVCMSYLSFARAIWEIR